MRDGTRTVLSMQNDYKGPPQNFALVVPVPVVLAKENVKTLSADVFQHIDMLSAPRLVEYWEQDPCPQPQNHGLAGISGGSFGGGAASGAGDTGGGAREAQVKVEAQFEVGEYEVVILSAKDSSALETWLRDNQYKIPENAAPALQPYVAAGMKFFVAKVNVAKVKMDNGHAALSPLRFYYDSDRFDLPVKLGLLNSSGAQDLIINIIASDRYEVANYNNVTIPTNFDVNEGARAGFGSFYTSLFDRTLAKHPNAVITEYAWNASSCDPCPGVQQGMSGPDLAALGADVMPNLKVTTNTREQATVRPGPITVNGKMPSAVIERIVRQTYGRFHLCYDIGLRSNPNLAGTVSVDFEMDGTGFVTSQASSGAATTMSDASVATCVVRGFSSLTFPAPEDKKPVKVTYPVVFSSTPDPKAPPPRVNVATAKGTPLTLTRLHARYSKESLGSDLIFRVANPIVGGRETKSEGKLEHGAAQRGGFNAFQARYAIRHPWPNKIACGASADRGEWGGPWPWLGKKTTEPLPATKLGLQKRGAALKSFTAASDDLLDVTLVSEASAVMPPLTPVAAMPDSSDAGASPPTSDAGAPTPPTIPPQSHCGCRAVGTSHNLNEVACAAMLLVLLLLRRKKH